MEIVHGPMCIKPSIRYRNEGKLDKQRTESKQSKTQHLLSQAMCSFNGYSLSSSYIPGTEDTTNKYSYLHEVYILVVRDIHDTK